MNMFLLLVLLVVTNCQEEEEEYIVGGESEDTLDDPVALNALNNFMIQLMDHALENGCFDNATERIVIGEIEHIEMQVVAGEKFTFTLMAGISNNCADAENHEVMSNANGDERYNRYFVSAEDCGINADELEEYTFSIVYQPWTNKGYNYAKIVKDLINNGNHPMQQLWDGGDECTQHRI